MGANFLPEFPDLRLLDIFPFTVLATFILLEIFIESSEEIGINVTEQAANIVNGMLIEVLVERAHKLGDFSIIALKATLQELGIACSDLCHLADEWDAHLLPEIAI